MKIENSENYYYYNSNTHTSLSKYHSHSASRKILSLSILEIQDQTLNSTLVVFQEIHWLLFPVLKKT